MNVMQQIQQLEAVGFAEELLDRAVAAAGANRLFYQELCRAVKEKGLSPAEALNLVEAGYLSDI